MVHCSCVGFAFIFMSAIKDYGLTNNADEIVITKAD